MQKIGTNVIKDVKRRRIKKLEFFLQHETPGVLMKCPSCNYVGKNKRGTAKIFLQESGERHFKCFACGLWRVIK